MKSGGAAAVLAMLVLSACADTGTVAQAVPADARNVVAGRVSASDFGPQAVADIIARGMAAEASGDAETLADQARALDILGATPEGGAPDLAREWRRKAAQMGAHISTDTFRGRTLGPAYRQGRVGPGASFHTRQSFNAGQRAEISVVPQDDAPLSLSVTDDDGRQICDVAPSTRNLGCRWVPTFTGSSDINVDNSNDRAVAFYIVLN